MLFVLFSLLLTLCWGELPRSLSQHFQNHQVQWEKIEALSGPTYRIESKMRSCPDDLYSPECQNLQYLKLPWWSKARWISQVGFPETIKNDYSFYLLNFSQINMRGYLFWRKGESPSPLFIVRGGIGSEALRFVAERTIIYPILIHQKAHVLFIGSSFNDFNLSSTQFKNAGPFQDAIHNRMLSHFWKHQDLKEVISQVYLMGISMSGLGALLSAYSFGDPSFVPYDRIFLVCPYIKYDLTVPPSMYWRTWLWGLFRFPRTLGTWRSLRHPLDQLFEQLNAQLSQSFTDSFTFFPEISTTGITNWRDFKNTLLSELKNVTPMRLIFTQLDHIVLPDENSKSLPSTLFEKILELKHGNHCNWMAVYPSEYVSHFFVTNNP